MNSYLWYYGLTANPDSYHGGFLMRGEAIMEGLKAARDHDYEVDEISIVEGQNAEINTDIFDGSELMEQLCEHNDEIANEDGDLGLDDRTAAQEHDLEQRLSTVLRTWLTDHRLGRVFAFKDTRNEAIIRVPPENQR